MSFEIALHVFDDPLAATRPDPHPDGDRWQTIGLVENTLLFVVHTLPELHEATGEEIGRIISARRAMSYERTAYEGEEF